MALRFNPVTGQLDIAGSTPPTDVPSFSAQANPGAVNTALYTLPADSVAFLNTLFVTNTSSTAKTFRVFYDADGTTYTTATAIAYDIKLAGNETMTFESFIPLSTAGGSLGVYGSTTDVTFTLMGAEIPV